MAEQAAVLGNEVSRFPSVLGLGCDVEVHRIARVLGVGGPVPDLVDDAAVAGKAVESRWLHCGLLMDERVIVADAGDKKAVGLEVAADGGDGLAKLS